MVRRINSRFGLIISLWRSPWAWFSGLIFLFSFYSFIRGEFNPQWPALGQFMPLWAYAILGLGLLWLATFETAYRYIRSIQPPSIAEIRKLLLRRQAEGFSIRKNRGDGWEAKTHAWYQTVLDDLTLIFGPDYSKLFDAELGRKPNSVTAGVSACCFRSPVRSHRMGDPLCGARACVNAAWSVTGWRCAGSRVGSALHGASDARDIGCPFAVSYRFCPRVCRGSVPATGTTCAASSQRYVYIRPGEAPGV
jgi:hypothetical protein